MKTIKRIVAMLLVVTTLFAICAVSASAATWRTGNFNRSHNSGYTTVYLSNAKKNGYIKIHTYNCVKGNHTGKCAGAGETNAKLKVTFLTTSGKWITQFNTTSKTKLKLGKDHKAYKINIAVRQDLGSAANFTNLGKCSHWAIEAVSNTYI